MSLTAYADADHAWCQDTRRSISGSHQFLGDKLVSWSSKKQKCMAISSTYAEYIALSGCCAQILWNEFSSTNRLSAKSNRFRYILKEQVENGIVELYFVRTEYQLAGIFTKPLPRERFNFLIEKLGQTSHQALSGKFVELNGLALSFSDIYLLVYENICDKSSANQVSNYCSTRKKLDLELFPMRKDYRMGNETKTQSWKIYKIPTFQVVLDALALTPCYSTFLITADVPEFYMHQFWDLVYKHDTFYRFKIHKRKRFKLTLEIFRDIFKICPRLQGQDFDALPTDERKIMPS
ncbi:hypothetical protein Tco_0774753 [Tanacetum coccineum]|uniref:Uncharacterized protein n=1 Tax=Tanacetum coccineum TaxID=301880 RepID=A0ABQ4ZQC5_9ASTR